MSSRRKLGPRVALLFGSCLVSLLVGEVFLRLFASVDYMAPPGARGTHTADADGRLLHRASSIPGLDYELVPGARKGESESTYARPTTINSHGMRDEEPLPAGAPGLVRLAVIGDSYTFGLGVDGPETYVEVLENRLNAASRPSGSCFDVLNLGVAGYNTRDEAIVFQHVALPWEPRLIIIGYCLNDPQIDAVQPLHAMFREPSWWQHSQLLRLVASKKRNWDIRTRGPTRPNRDYYFYLHAEGHRHWQSVVTAFADIHEAAAERGIPVVVVIFPVFPVHDGWEGYRYAPLHEQVAAAARGAGLDVLDLTNAYAGHAPADLAVAPDDPHPNRLGHEVAAEAIHRKLAADYPEILGAGARTQQCKRPSERLRAAEADTTGALSAPPPMD